MNKDVHFHLAHYLTLFLILGLGVVAIFNFVGNKNRQFLVVIITSMLYFLWGVVHHWLEEDLHPKIVVEYLLIAILSIFLLRGAIYR